MSIQRNIFLERAGLLKNNESAEVLDELSKSTLGSYVGKAYKDQGERMAKTGVLVGLHSAEHGKAPTIKQTKKIVGKDEVRKDKNRDAGVDRAVSRLSKEEYEEINEGLLSSASDSIGHFMVKQMARAVPKDELRSTHTKLAHDVVSKKLGLGHAHADKILDKHHQLAKKAEYHNLSDDEARERFADHGLELHKDIESAKKMK